MLKVVGVNNLSYSNIISRQNNLQQRNVTPNNGRLLRDTVSFTSLNSNNPVTLYSKLSNTEAENIIQKIIDGNYTLSGEGTNSKCVRIDDMAVRFFKPGAKNYGNDITYEKEAFALKKVKEAGITDSQELIDVIKNGDKHYIITNFIEGKPLNAQKGRVLNAEQTKDVLKKLTLLDKSGFIQYDAQIENIFFDGNTARLIDFGGFSTVVGDIETYKNLKSSGLPMEWDFYPSFSRMKSSDIKGFDLENKLKNAKPYLGFVFENNPAISRNSNPFFGALSNIANFEYRSLFYHLFDIANTKDSTTSENILRTYLNQRAENFHKPIAEFFESLNVDEAAHACGLNSEEMVSRIKNALGYEKMMTDILLTQDLSNEVLKTELAKMQIRWVANECPKSARVQYEDLTSMIRNFSEHDSGTLKQYFSDSLAFFEKLKPGIYAMPESAERVPLDESKNLVKRLFNKVKQVAEQTAEHIKETPIPETTSNASDTIKTAKNNKMIAAIIAGLAIIGGVILFVVNKNKKNKNIAINKVSNNQLQPAEIKQPAVQNLYNQQPAHQQNSFVNLQSATQLNTFSIQDFMQLTKK